IRQDVYDFFVNSDPQSLTQRLRGLAGLRAASDQLSEAAKAQHARDLQRLTDARDIGSALAGFHKDHASYPLTPLGQCEGGAYDNFAGLSGYLAPRYIKSIPKDRSPRSCAYNYLYQSDSLNYAVLIDLESVDHGKYPDGWCIAARNGALPS